MCYNSIMGCLCCCFRPPPDEDPNALVKKDAASCSSPFKSYGTITSDETETEKKSTLTPPSSGNELLYSGQITSARVKSPVNTTEENASPVKSSKNSNGKNSKPSQTLAELALLAKKTTSAFSPHSNIRTSTPNPDLQNDSNKAEHKDTEESKFSFVQTPTSGSTSVQHSAVSDFESDTCHSIPDSYEEDEEESEDAKTLRMLPSIPSTSPSMTPGDSNEQLVKVSSPGSSSLDVSKDSTGKKPSKAKDFMKKAGKKMKKTKKKMGKGVDKMLHRDKKKEEEEESKMTNTKEKAGSSTIVPHDISSNAQFKRVSSERMKSKYARERVAALEKKREEEASKQAATSSGGITDPRLAALERGEKLSELEDQTELMREHAAGFARTASMLRSQQGSSS